ncbi:enterochelin esterase family protein [Tahibacter aquaticus]|uniref:Enterochelin esterase family protein n=2 Tax=Tahibacter aquaticus TaxID=520092 RepID=A0A4R6YQ30_9GAMM|nr:enterochelin esterase family protein [Tahibacter aquaticus]
MPSRYMFALRLCLLIAFCACARAQDSERAALQSPRLAALLAEVDRHDANAIDAFWREIETVHSPLIEDLPGHPDEALFTFLWRADPDEDAINIRLGASFPTRTINDPFSRLGNTSVWFTSYLMPRNARLIYRLRAPQGMQKSTLSRDRFTIEGIRYELFPDPLNPATFPRGSAPAEAQSVATGPAAKENVYLQAKAGVPAGTVHKEEFDSAALQGKRTLTVYTPAGYAAHSPRLPLLLVFDAEAYLDQIAAPTILDNLIAAGKIPPVIAVFVHSAGTRDTDLPPNDRFPAFIVDEVLPHLQQRYRLTADPRKTIACGSSLGGLAAAHLAYRHPQAFGQVISQSGSYWWWREYQTEPGPSAKAGWLIKQIAESKKRPVRFYLEAGLWESAGMIYANRMLASVLRGKGYAVDYHEFIGGHHYAYWQQTFPDALIAVLGK